MPPEIFVEKELRFRVANGRLNLRYQQVKPNSKSDFVTTQGSTKRDVAFFKFGDSVTGDGVAVDPFYVGANVVKDFQLGNDIHIKNSQNQRVAIVHLDGPTTVDF